MTVIKHNTHDQIFGIIKYDLSEIKTESKIKVRRDYLSAVLSCTTSEYVYLEIDKIQDRDIRGLVIKEGDNDFPENVPVIIEYIDKEKKDLFIENILQDDFFEFGN